MSEKETDTDHSSVPDLVPTRMLNEYVYCPRLCYIEWIQGEFVDSADTVEGRYKHRRVDRASGKIPEEDEEIERFHAQSVYLSGSEVGITSRLDIIEGEGRKATPVDYKRGRAPDIDKGAWDADRVQICAQALVLRENGFDCDEGIVYYALSKKRVPVPIEASLVELTLNSLNEMRQMAENSKMPPPLLDSPKCPRCSLVGICLPDEVNILRSEDMADVKPRNLLPPLDEGRPVYVIGQGYTVRKKGDVLEIRSYKEKAASARLREVSQLLIYGNVQVTTQTLNELLQRGVPVCFFSHGGWFYGIAQGHVHKNVELRMLQYRTALDEKMSLALSRQFVNGKIKNCRTMLRRNNPDIPKTLLDRLSRLAKDSLEVQTVQSLLGIEGSAAQAYFSRFDHMLKTDIDDFSFKNRNKRPPKDPVNSVLSYLYGILTKELFVTVLSVGFDPYLGFYHRPKYGRPALALDLMEEFRPLIADSVAITLFNTGELGENDFVRTGAGVSITAVARKKIVKAFERRMETEITHPIFGYRIKYRRVLNVQARLLSRVLSEEIPTYPPFCTR